eukprot:scaffold38990_cov26-Tisochrysis_lutea.AAC.8
MYDGERRCWRRRSASLDATTAVAAAAAAAVASVPVAVSEAGDEALNVAMVTIRPEGDTPPSLSANPAQAAAPARPSDGVASLPVPHSHRVAMGGAEPVRRCSDSGRL